MICPFSLQLGQTQLVKRTGRLGAEATTRQTTYGLAFGAEDKVVKFPPINKHAKTVSGEHSGFVLLIELF
jgi:hypothetical protein